jgi:hypothetical protein
VSIENSAIKNYTKNHIDISYGTDVIYMNDGPTMNAITFGDLIRKYKLNYLDFLKIDCEGGEYSIFTPENYYFLTKNIAHISGEWHVWGFENVIEKFIDFRDNYLVTYDEYKIFDRFDTDITNNAFSDDFITSYSEKFTHGAQFIIYLTNNNAKPQKSWKP